MKNLRKGFSILVVLFVVFTFSLSPCIPQEVVAASLTIDPFYELTIAPVTTATWTWATLGMPSLDGDNWIVQQEIALDMHILFQNTLGAQLMIRSDAITGSATDFRAILTYQTVPEVPVLMSLTDVLLKEMLGSQIDEDCTISFEFNHFKLRNSGVFTGNFYLTLILNV